MLFTTESTETQWPRLIKIKNRKRKSKQKRGSHDTYYCKTDLQGKNIIKDEEIFRLNQTQQQTSNYTKLIKLIEIKGEIYKITVLVGDFNILLSKTDSAVRWKTSNNKEHNIFSLTNAYVECYSHKNEDTYSL